MTELPPPTFQDVLNFLEQEHPGFAKHVLAAFPWGSRVYGNALPDSDYDIIVILEDNILSLGPLDVIKSDGYNSIDKKFIVLENEWMNQTLISFSDWKFVMIQHNHEALEVLFMDKSKIIYQSEQVETFHNQFIIDKDLLRRTASWESKRRFSRAPFPAQISMRKGKKDMVHALRYLLFAIQIMEHDRIVDYTAANSYYKQIVLDTADTVTTLDQFKKLMLDWEPTRYEISHRLGLIRTSRKFYHRGEMVRRFMQTHRMKHTFLYISRDDEMLYATPEDAKGIIATILDQFRGCGTLLSLTLQHKLLRMFDKLDPYFVQLVPHTYLDTWTDLTKIARNGMTVELIPSKSNSPLKVRIACIGPPPSKSYLSLSDSQKMAWNAILQNESMRSDLVIEELIDGTLVHLYYRSNSWTFSTKLESINPEVTLNYVGKNNAEIPISKAVESVWNSRNLSFPPSEQWSHFCFSFIFTYNQHRYIVGYDTEEVYFINAWNLQTGLLEDYRSIAAKLGWKCPPAVNTANDSLEVLQEEILKWSPMQKKGFIVKHFSFDPWNPIVLQSPMYVSTRYATDLDGIGQMNLRCEMDKKMILDQAIHKTGNLLALYHPFWKQKFEMVNSVYMEFCSILDEEYIKHRHKPREQFVKDVGPFKFANTLYKLQYHNFPSSAELFGLAPSRHQYFMKPWKQFLNEKYPEIFHMVHGLDQKASEDD